MSIPNLNDAISSMKSSQVFQARLMKAQVEHSKNMAAINAMKTAADKIRG